MATRRPRVKPSANLKPRRPQSTLGNNENVSNSIKSELENEDKNNKLNIEEEQISDDQILSGEGEITNETEQVTNNKIETENSADVKDVDEAEEHNIKPEIQSKCDGNRAISTKATTVSSTTAPQNQKSFRHVIPPAVNVLSSRHKNLVNTESKLLSHVSPVYMKSPAHLKSPVYIKSPAYMKSPAYPYVFDNFSLGSSSIKKTEENFVASVKNNRKQDHRPDHDDIFSPATPDNDECFKSPPFMSPSIYSRRPEPSMSPYIDGYGDDYAKSPSSVSSNRIRAKIRPTPCFGNRRNSTQGSIDSEDETVRRQRHYSTSSNYSSYTQPNTPQPQRNNSTANKLFSRNRTESICSNMSDTSSVRDFNTKQKRVMKSDELQRMPTKKREFSQKLTGKPLDKSRLTMYDYIHYNPTTNPMRKSGMKNEYRSDAGSVASMRTTYSRNSVKSELSVKAERSEVPVEQNMPVPQLKLGPNNEIVIDEKSLVIETTGDKEAREALANSDVVYDDEFSGTSGFYKRHKRTKDWPAEETIKFYRSLQTIGTDFSVMLQLFPNRTRRDLKLKFKKEEKHNMALINKALRHPKEFNVEELKLQFDKEDEEFEAKKAEWDALKKKLAREKKKQLTMTKKRLGKKAISNSTRCLTNGDTLYENEFIKVPKGKVVNSRRMSTDQLNVQNHTQTNASTPNSSAEHSYNMDQSVQSSPQQNNHNQKLPSFNEVLTSKSYYQTDGQLVGCQNNNNFTIDNKNNFVVNHSELKGKNIPQSILCKSPPGVSDHSYSRYRKTTITKPCPVTCNNTVKIKTIAETPSNTNAEPTTSLNTIPQDTISTVQTNQNQSFYISQNQINAVPINSTSDIMSMDIIFDDMPIEKHRTIETSIETIPHTNCASNENRSSRIIELNNLTYEIITFDEPNPAQVENANGSNSINSIRVYSERSSRSSESIMVQTGNSSENLIIIPDNSPSDVYFSDNNTQMKAPAATNISEGAKPQKANIKQEQKIDGQTTVKHEVVSVAEKKPLPSLKRKNKLLPILVDRNKRPHRMNEPTKERPIKISEETSLIQNDNVTTNAKPTGTIAAETKQIIKNEVLHPVVNNRIPNDVEVVSANTSDSISSGSDNLMDSLVVVESQDPTEPSKTIHEVYVMCPKTKQLSEQPLDLPDEVIQKIRMSMTPSGKS